MEELKLHVVVVGLFLLMSRQSDCGCDFNSSGSAIFPVPTFIEPKDECFTNMGYIGSANYPNSNPAGDIIDSCYLRSNDSNYENITVTVTILNFNQFIRQGRHHLTVSAISRSDCQSSNATLYIEGPETHNYDPDYDINYMETITADIINVQYEQQQQQNVGNGGYYILGFEGEQNILVTCESCTGVDCVDFNFAVCTPPTTELTPTTESGRSGSPEFQNSTNKDDGFPWLLIVFVAGGVLLLVVGIIIIIIIIMRKRDATHCTTCTICMINGEKTHKETNNLEPTEEHAEKDEPLDEKDIKDMEDYSYATTTPYTNPLFHGNENNKAGSGVDTTQTSGSCEYSEIMNKQTANGRHSKDSNELVMEDNQNYGM